MATQAELIESHNAATNALLVALNNSDLFAIRTAAAELRDVDKTILSIAAVYTDGKYHPTSPETAMVQAIQANVEYRTEGISETILFMAQNTDSSQSAATIANQIETMHKLLTRNPKGS